MAPCSIQHVALLTCAPVASFGIDAFSILTYPRQEALVDVLTVCDIHPFKTFGTFHLSICNHCERWFGWTLLAFVQSPGGANTSTAIILFGQAWQRLATLSVDCLLKASSNVSVLTDVRCGVAMAVSIGVRVSAAVLTGVFVSIPRLRALLDRVSTLSGGLSLPRLDSSYLVDLDFGLWRMLDVDVHQGWVEGRLLIGQRQSVHGVGW